MLQDLNSFVTMGVEEMRIRKLPELVEKWLEGTKIRLKRTLCISNSVPSGDSKDDKNYNEMLQLKFD